MIRQRYAPQHTSTIGAEAPDLAATFDAKSDGIGTEYVCQMDGPNKKTSAWISVLGLGFGGLAAFWPFSEGRGVLFERGFFWKTNQKGMKLLHLQYTISHLVITINITDILWNLTNMWLLW
jgi:hypothetical protein